jgi:putative transcriptional regulator
MRDCQVILSTAEPITATEVRWVREKSHLSQAALARFLNMTTGYVAQLERGAPQAKGPTLALLNVIRRKGSRRFCDRVGL